MTEMRLRESKRLSKVALAAIKANENIDGGQVLDEIEVIIGELRIKGQGHPSSVVVTDLLIAVADPNCRQNWVKSATRADR